MKRLLPVLILCVSMVSPAAWSNIDTDLKNAMESINMGDFQTALRLLTKVIENDDITDEIAIKAFNYRGEVFNSLGNYDEAIIDFDKSISIEPFNSESYFYRSKVYYKKGKLVEAILDLNQSIALDSKEDSYQVYRANLWEEYGDIKRAITDYDLAISTDNLNPNNYLSRGIAFAKSGEYGRAISDYFTTLKFDENNVVANVMLGWLYSTHSDSGIRNPSLGLKFSKRAHDLSPNTPFTNEAIATAYAINGDYTNAVKFQENVIRIMLAQGTKIPQKIENTLHQFKFEKPYIEPNL